LAVRVRPARSTDLRGSCSGSWRRRGKPNRGKATDQAANPFLGYHLKGTPAQFIGLVFDQPDDQAAIKRAIEEFKMPANQRDRLMAQWFWWFRFHCAIVPGFLGYRSYSTRRLVPPGANPNARASGWVSPRRANRFARATSRRATGQNHKHRRWRGEHLPGVLPEDSGRF
jgi:hypothetical protein